MRKLAIGAEAAGVHYLRTLEDSAAIEAALSDGKNVVVIGGGFIGLEVAASARQRGCNVTVLEIADSWVAAYRRRFRIIFSTCIDQTASMFASTPVSRR